MVQRARGFRIQQVKGESAVKHCIVKPAKCECEMLADPIPPCEMLRNGCPGSLTINGTLYAVSLIAHLPPAPAEPVIDGYRLTKENGESHDLCLVNGRVECTCGDWELRRAAMQEAVLMDCKHIKAIKQLFLYLPRDQYELSCSMVNRVFYGEHSMEFDNP